MKNFYNYNKKNIFRFFLISALALCSISIIKAQTYTIVGTASSSSCGGPSFLLQGSCGNTIIACCVSPSTIQPTIGAVYFWNGSVFTSGGYQNLSLVSGNICPCVLNGVTVSANPSIISAGNSTTLTASPSGAGYSYSWGHGASGSSVTVSPSRTTSYTVTVTNQNCSGSASAQVSVTGGCNLTAIATASPSSIAQGGSTTLSVTPSFGTPPYTYLWSNGNTNASQTVTPSSSTTYNVTVTDNAGCQAYAQTGCVVNPVGCGSFSTYIQTSSGLSSISIGGSTTLNAFVSGGSGNYTYAWSNGIGGGSFPNSVTVSPTTSTTYSVTVTDPVNNCSATSSFTVNVTNCSLSATAISTPAFIAPGGSATISATASGGTPPYTYIWSDGLLLGTSHTVSPLSTKTYTVSVTDANGLTCQTTATATVTVNDCSFTVTPTSNPASIVAGNSSTISVSASGGSGNYAYSWSNGSTSASQNVLPTATTTYFVTVTDNSNGCKIKGSTTVSVGNCPPINVSLSATPSSIAPGGSSTLNVSASGGTGSYVYAWSNGAGGTNQTVTPSNTTTYSVTATDGNGCKGNASTTVIVGGCTLTVSASSSTSTITSGSSATLTASATGGSGSYTYAWSNGATGASQTVSPNASTTYYVTVTDANGCTASSSVTISTGTGSSCTSSGFHVILNALPSTVAANNPVDLSAAAANGSGNYSYTWSNGLGTGANKTVYPTSNTTYYVTVTDNVTGCIASSWSTVTVSGISTPCYLTASVSASAAVIPLGGSSILTPTASGGSGNYQYMWWGWGSYTTPVSRTVVPTTTTTYELRVYDLNNEGCYANASVTVAVCTLAVSASSTPSVINFGESTTLSASASGGSGIYTYTWSNGFVGQTQTVSPTAPTTNYTVTVTSSNGTCGNAAITTVTVLGSPCAAFAGSITPQAMTSNGTVQLTASGAGGSGSYSYMWSNGITTNTQTVAPTTTTTYTVTITDNTNGCQATASVTVPPRNPPCIESAGNGYCCDQSSLSAGQIAAQSTALLGEVVAINNVQLPTGGTTSAGSSMGGGVYQYTFEVLSGDAGITSWTVIGTANSYNISTTYTPPAPGFYYIRRCVRLRCGNNTLTSGVCTQITFTVNACDNVTNAGTISGAETNCNSYNPNLITSTAVATGGTTAGGAITYQWQISTNGTNWSDIPNATSETYDPPNVITGTTYYRRGARRGVCPFIYST